MPGQFAVEFREVTYRAGGKLILDQLSFGVEPGETLVLLGRSPLQIFQDRVARRESQDDKPAAPVLRCQT